MNVEIQGTEIRTSNGHLKIFNVYLSPANILTMEDFQKYFFNNRTILVGDFNAHNQMWGCSLTKSRGRILEEILI